MRANKLRGVFYLGGLLQCRNAIGIILGRNQIFGQHRKPKTVAPETLVGLGDTIIKVREELVRSFDQARATPELRFRYEAVELEFEITLTTETEAGGGLQVWVVNADGKRSRSHGQVNRIKVSLTPLDPLTDRPPELASHMYGRPNTGL